jgi:MFS family permease
MHQKGLGDTKRGQKDVFTASALVINALAWLFMISMMLDNLLTSLEVTETQNIIIWTVYYVTLTGSGIIGASLSHKVNRIKFLGLWIIFGALVSSFPALLITPTVNHILVLAILLGCSLGIGIPSCLAYFADSTSVENRGLTSGLIFLSTNLIAIAIFLIGFVKSDVVLNSLILAIWRASGLLVFFIKPKEKIGSETKTRGSFKAIFNNKSFLLYFVAWFMFMLVDRSEAPMVRFFSNDPIYLMLAPIIGSASVFVAGFLADRVGRKRIVITGFVTFGIAYAVIGLAPDLPISRYFFLAIESVSTGILVAAFILLLWGDLSKFGAREKYYAIGVIPFFLTSIIQLFTEQYFMSVPNTSAFSLAAFFLFLAVLPLLYAPETLPEKKMELRRLRSFAEDAKKAREKYERKMKKGKG